MYNKSVKTIILLLIILLTGCTKSSDITKEEYKRVQNMAKLDNGMNIIEFKDTILRFVYKVYNPQEEDDISEGLNIIKEISTTREYNELKSIAKFNAGKRSSISDIDIQYSGKTRTVYVELGLKVDNYYQRIAIEFVLNNEGKIFKHYIWTGRID